MARFLRTLQSKGDDEEKPEGRGRKVPIGFEKLLRKTRKGTSHDSKKSEVDGKEADAAEKDDEDTDKKAKEDESDGEHEDKGKEDDKQEKTKEEEQSWRQRVYNFFMEPNGGGPNYENWLKVVVIGGLCGYYALFMQPPSEEVTYMDFV